MSMELDPVQFRMQLIHDFKEAMWEIVHERNAPSIYRRDSSHHSSHSSASSFAELVRQLETSHEHVVAELRNQVKQLQASNYIHVSVQSSQNNHNPQQIADSTVVDLDGIADGRRLPVEIEKVELALFAEDFGDRCPDSLAIKHDNTEADTSLKVTVVNGKEIKRVDSILGASMGATPHSPFCCCEIKEKPGSGFTTNTGRRSHNPTWNHDEILFDYSPGDTLSFSIHDKDMQGNVVLLGASDLPSSSFFPGGFQDAIKLNAQGSLLNVKIELASRGAAIPVLPVCLKGLHQDSRQSKKKTMFGRDSFDCTSVSGMSTDSAITQGSSGARQRVCTTHAAAPDTTWHLVWDIFGIVILMTDLIWIPMQVFDPKDTSAVRALMWVILLYWTFDMFITFNTGFYDSHSTLHVRRAAIALRYMRGWFFFDLLLVSIDWYGVVNRATGMNSFGGSSAGAARAGRLARLTRIFRLLRLMRLAKLRRLLFALQSLIDSEWLAVSFAVGKNMLLILMLNHYMACAWFYVGKSAGSEGWVDRLNFTGMDFGTQYLESLVWSLAQFTPGASPISALSTGERIYVVMVLSCSMIVATCFVGNISVTMGTVWAANRYNSHQGFLLKKFLQQRGISRELGTQVTRYIDCVVELRHKVVPIGRVEYLKLLSGPLSVELHTMIFQPFLVVHRFFRLYNEASRTAVRQLCSTSVETECYAKHDSVFQRGQVAKKMYFVTRGALAYRFSNTQKYKQAVKLDVHFFLSEATLWVAWKYRGHLKGLSDCEVLNLHSAKFWDVTSKATPSVCTLAREEALSFASRLRTCTSFGSGYINDLAHAHMAVLLSEQESQRSYFHDIARAEHFEAETIGFSDSESESDDDLESRATSAAGTSSHNPKT